MISSETPKTDKLTESAMDMDGAKLLVRYDDLRRHAQILEKSLRRLFKFTFDERWPSKGLDEEAQKVHDQVENAINL